MSEDNQRGGMDKAFALVPKGNLGTRKRGKSLTVHPIAAIAPLKWTLFVCDSRTFFMSQYLFNSFHSSVATFSFDLVPATLDHPHQLAVIVGDDKRALSRYISYEAIKEAIRTQKTGFPLWDSLPPQTAAREFSEPGRWISIPIRTVG